MTLPYVYLELFPFDTFLLVSLLVRNITFLPCSNDTRLGVHVSCNELKCRVQVP